VARNLGRPFFVQQKSVKKSEYFFEKNILLVSLSQKNQTQVSQLQQTFPELILEPREERKAFYKSN